MSVFHFPRRDEAEMEYLKIAQDLEMYGVNYFAIRVCGSFSRFSVFKQRLNQGQTAKMGYFLIPDGRLFNGSVLKKRRGEGLIAVFSILGFQLDPR